MSKAILIQLFSALRLSLAAVCSIYIAMSIGLENPYWAPVTVLVIEAGFQGAVQQRIRDRIWGTILGVITGLSVLFIAGDMRFVLIALSFSLVTLTSYLSLEYRNQLLLWRWTALTIMLMIVIGLSFDYDTFFMTNLSRIWSILVGISVAWVFHVLFFPLASAVGIFSTLKKIIALLRSISPDTDVNSKVTALSGFYVLMGELSPLIASHALEKYGTTLRARQAQSIVDALEIIGEQIITEDSKTPEFVSSVLNILDSINPFVITSLQTTGNQLQMLCAEVSTDIPVKLLHATQTMGQELATMDMSVDINKDQRVKVESRVYFFDAWYDDTFTNAYKSLVIGIGTSTGLWLWSEVDWPGGLFLVVLIMIIGQFTAFSHIFSIKALGILVILSLIITNLLMIFIIPLFDASGSFFTWLFLIHLFFTWFAFSSNKKLAFAALLLLMLINLFVNGYVATPYAMQITLTYSWGVLGGLTLGLITASLVKPASAHQLLQKQKIAFSDEISQLESASETERQNLLISLRYRAHMLTVWWRDLSEVSVQQMESQSILDLIRQLPSYRLK
ncbi:MAG: FUSC family protein [gamma proteobacterium symbiont of Taylorina sp.]|nr:FUSC family protein [gamma proteobacterium symbiont of Taylorina sp.]